MDISSSSVHGPEAARRKPATRGGESATLFGSMGTLLKRALDQAAVWHRAQTRKYPNADVPYISHPAGVAVLLARHGFADEVLAAGALHDVVEDQGISYDELARRFGERVAALVRHVTEQDKSQPWEERKRRYLEAFPHKPWEAQAITLADKIDNFDSILVCAADHGDPWAMFKRGKDAQIARFEELRRLTLALPPHPLIDEYGSALDALIERWGPGSPDGALRPKAPLKV